MADQNGSVTLKENTNPAVAAVDSKGKGKAAAEPDSVDTGMDVDESSSEEEVDDVRHIIQWKSPNTKLTSTTEWSSW